MKRKKLMALLMATGIVLTGCGDITVNIDRGSDTQKETEVEEDSEVEGVAGSKEEETEASQKDATETGEETETDDEQKIDETTEVLVEVTTDTVSDEIAGEGEGTIYSWVYEIPVITVVGNEEVTEAIAKDIEKRRSELSATNKEMEEMARGHYDMLSTEEKEEFGGYSDFSSYDVTYQNDEMISILYEHWSYTAGAHGSTVMTTANYSLKTGELLSFDTFFEEKETALQAIEESILKQCESQYYKEMLFENYKESLKNIIKEEYWYFQKDGMHIVANQYEIAPYAAGVLEFIIPYTEMPEMKGNYITQDFFMCSSIYGQEVEIDLDSDGTKEKICYDKLEEDAEEYGATKCSIMINDKDCGYALNDLEDVWIEVLGDRCYFVDLDTSDNYIEIGVESYGSNDYHNTYFLRYDNGEVTYLGHITDLISGSTCEVFGDGTVTAMIGSVILETSRLEGLFKLENDVLWEEAKEWYEKNEYPHEVLKEVTVYTENSVDSDTKILTSEDGPVSFLATDNLEWVKLKTKDGDIYYLHMTGFTEIDSDGTAKEATEVFAELFLAG